MTVSEAISKADAIAPNQYTDQQKLDWLSTLDGRIYHEVFRTHEPGFGVMLPYEGHDSTDDELFVQEPYGADLYVNYLLSRVAEANAEIQKYNLYATLFNEAYKSFTNKFNREHMPKEAGPWRF